MPRLPYKPILAYTPECHTAVPMRPWLEGGFDSIMPMAYWNSDGVSPSWCIDWLLRGYCEECGHCPGCAVPVDKAQVMLDGYSHGSIVDPAHNKVVHRLVSLPLLIALLRSCCSSLRACERSHSAVSAVRDYSWEDYAVNMSSEPGARGLSIWRTLHANEWPTWKGILQQYNISRVLR